MSEVTSRWPSSSISMINNGASRRNRPIEVLIPLADSYANGQFQVSINSMFWVVNLENGRITYASNSVAPFERLELHLRRLSHSVPSLVPETRTKARQLFDPEVTGSFSNLNADYQAICWFVEQKYLNPGEAARLIEGIVKEVLESLLLVSEGTCDFQDTLDTVPKFCRFELPGLVDYCQQRLQDWQALGPQIWSPYQRPYLFSQNQAQHRLTPELQRKLGSILKGFSFRQLAALLNQDEIKVAKGLRSYILDGTVLLREPKPPFHQFPRIPVNSVETVVKPLAEPKQAPVPEQTVLQSSESSTRLQEPVSPPAKVYTIACIDDSATILNEMQRFLSDDSFAVHAINDPLKALIQVIRLKPDLILLDIGMPNIDGYKLCRLLRNHSLFGNTPIVMVTGNTGIIDRAKAKFAGASDYMTKPFTRSELLEVVFRHLS